MPPQEAQQATSGKQRPAATQPLELDGWRQPIDAFTSRRLGNKHDIIATAGQAVCPFNRIATGTADSHLRRQDEHLHGLERKLAMARCSGNGMNILTVGRHASFKNLWSVGRRSAIFLAAERNAEKFNPFS